MTNGTTHFFDRFESAYLAIISLTFLWGALATWIIYGAEFQRIRNIIVLFLLFLVFVVPYFVHRFHLKKHLTLL